MKFGFSPLFFDLGNQELKLPTVSLVFLGLLVRWEDLLAPEALVFGCLPMTFDTRDHHHHRENL